MKNGKEKSIDLSILKYFWQASPLSLSKNKNLLKFLKEIKFLEGFTDYEIWVFMQYMHERSYQPNETIFKKGDSGLAFYIIYDGNVNIFSNTVDQEGPQNREGLCLITELKRNDYLGEMSIIDETMPRNATAVAEGKVTLLAMYKPDLNELLESYPVVGAKFMRSIARVILKRFQSVTVELMDLKKQLFTIESANEE